MATPTIKSKVLKILKEQFADAHKMKDLTATNRPTSKAAYGWQCRITQLDDTIMRIREEL